MLIKKVPVAHHVRKFLVWNFGDQYLFSVKDWIAPIVACMFKRGYRVRAMKKGEAEYTLKIPEKELLLIGKTLEPQNIYLFNNAIDKIFRKQLYTHIDLCVKLKKGKAKQAMLEFLEECDITEFDINFDSLYRDYQRKHLYAKSDREHIGNQLLKNNLPKRSFKIDQKV